MISSDEISEECDTSKAEVIETELSVDEQAFLYSLDADIEDAATRRRNGEMFEVLVSRLVSLNVIAAIKRVWESGGWIVGIFEIVDPGTRRPVREREGDPSEFVFRLVFARPRKKQSLGRQAVTECLENRQQAEEFTPPSESASTIRMSTPLLIRMPTRSRPEQALEVLRKYRDLALDHVAIEVVLDDDDATMNNTIVLQRLADLDCTITTGKHGSKIAACNAGRIDDWRVLVLASDDMMPVVRGYDQRILAAMEKHFPLFDGALNFNDGFNRDHVRPGETITCTLPVVGRHVYEEILDRHVYYSKYKSIYCDTDQSFLLNAMNRMAFIDEIIVEHRHPAAGKAHFDELYQFNSRYDDQDRLLFEERRLRGFDAPKIVLSVLICAIPSRREQLERLVSYLRWQMRRFPKQVEVCIDLDTQCTVGEKRQRLLERAVGKFVVHIDDDDWVDSRYIERVLKACSEDKDCCSLVGTMTTNGANPERFEHSIKYAEWRTNDHGVHERYPNHLNAIRRDLALQVPFVNKSVGEDHDWSTRILPLLKTEASTGDSPLYLYWAVPNKSVQSARGAS